MKNGYKLNRVYLRSLDCVLFYIFNWMWVNIGLVIETPPLCKKRLAVMFAITYIKAQEFQLKYFV